MNLIPIKPMMITRTYLGIFIASLVAQTACFTKNRPAFDPNVTGGEITLEQCGYTVKTREGATAPQTSTPFVGGDPAPFAVHLTVAADPSRNMAILWRTKDNETLSTIVEYGVGDNLDQRIDGFTFYYKTIDSSVIGIGGREDINIRMHEAHLCGLQPNTVYSYRVGSIAGTDRVFSPTYKFRTAPNPGDSAEIQALVIGDCRQGYDTWSKALAKVEALGKPDIILFNGDAVEYGNLQTEWDKWFAASENFFATIPLVYAHGNHDNNFVNYYSQFAFPGDEQNFGFDYGSFHVTVLNDTPEVLQDIYGPVPQAMELDLAKATTAPWRFVMHHKPLYSAARTGRVDEEMVKRWTPIMDQYHVDMDFNGHDHNYERSKPMRNGSPVAFNSDGSTTGTVYAVIGTSGAALYDNGINQSTEISEKTFNFAIVKVRPGQVSYRAYRVEDGSVIDDFKITKPLAQP